MKDRIAFYMHAGSGNHGCEAIVDSLVRMLPQERILLMTNSGREDRTYLPQQLRRHLVITEENHIEEHFWTHVRYYIHRRLTKDAESFLRYRFAPITGADAPRLAVSIGGDNYCYPSMVDDLILTNSMLNRQGTATMLLGCSIEPDSLSGSSAMREDMNRYRLILARESITQKALLDAGVPEEKVRFVPDPAFTLPADTSNLPKGFQKGNTIGINISPMIQAYSEDADLVLQSYVQLVQWLLKETSYTVCLIPHVVWARSDDRIPVRALASEFRGEKRVITADDMPAEQIKGIISGCRMFIGARTHATIAAYSTMVPTLVIGYSVKARGIAQDLFGTDENYVLPVQNLREPEELTKAAGWLLDHESDIRAQLVQNMPAYRASAFANGEAIRSLYASLAGPAASE